jgi:hypothetical protein
VLPEGGEYGVCDATRILLRERPPLDRWQLLSEEGVRGRHRLVKGARQSLLQWAKVVRPEDASAPGVDGTGSVAGAIALDRGLDEGANELGLRLGGRSRPRLLHEDECLHGVRGVERQLERDHGAG